MQRKSSDNNLATKKDLKKLATKVELKKVEENLRGEILRVEERIERVEDKLTNKIDGIEVKLDRIAVQLDGFVGRVDNLTTENEIGASQLSELRTVVNKHEVRITKLESKTH